MDDAERNTTPDPGTFGSGLSAQGDQRSWTPMIMGAVVVVVVVAIIVWVTHNSSGSGALNQADPYIARLQISNLHMATAENFAGGAVTYIEGKLANSGDKKVTAARVELVLKTLWVRSLRKSLTCPSWCCCLTALMLTTDRLTGRRCLPDRQRISA